VSEVSAAVAYLRSPLAIRARCETICEAGLAGALNHFTVELGAMPAVVDRVAAITRAAYPDLKIPTFGRMTHFRAGGVDRVAQLDLRLAGLSQVERARAWVDAVTVSVLLDAYAGDAWRFREGDQVLTRSEGLAVASLRAFEAGVFSSDRNVPLRADAEGLATLDAAALAGALQIDADNPLNGFDGRVALLRALGRAIAASPRIFPGGRPGGLLDTLKGELNGPALLGALLVGLAPIWPGRLDLSLGLGGHNLGDVWRHPAAGGTGPSAGLVPLHGLSQWLAYSLFEPFERAGRPVAQPGALTGIADHRNGGLLVDLGVIVPRRPNVTRDLFAVGDEVIVEWRALTVALLDRVAEGVQRALGGSPAELPLSRVLAGGTWAAGRAVAAERRPKGTPPIRIESDGTVL
jgi:hypothetical protein